MWLITSKKHENENKFEVKYKENRSFVRKTLKIYMRIINIIMHIHSIYQFCRPTEGEVWSKKV